MLGHLSKAAVTLSILAFAGSVSTQAAQYKYTTLSITLNPPGQLSVFGLDSAGDVVGWVSNRNVAKKTGTEVGFAYVNGAFALATPINGKFYSYASDLSSNGNALLSREPVGKNHVTWFKWDIVANKISPLYVKGAIKLDIPEAINSAGDVAGACYNGACLVSGKTFAVMTPKVNNAFANVYGLNDVAFSAGSYDTGDQTPTLFTYENGTTNIYTIPNATDIGQFGGISNNGAVVGYYENSSGVYGFSLIGGRISSFSYPGSTDTMALAINSSGQIVGTYAGGGFLFQNGMFYSLKIPNSTMVFANYINDQGTIAGSYTPTNSKYQVGFIATCETGPGTCTP